MTANSNVLPPWVSASQPAARYPTAYECRPAFESDWPRGLTQRMLPQGPIEDCFVGYELHWGERGVVKRYVGTVTAHDVIQSAVDVERDSRFDDLRYVINDFLEIVDVAVTGLEIERLAAIDKGAFETNPKIRIAIVTDRDDVVGLAREYADSPVHVYPTRIFSTLRSAKEWLGALEGDA